MLLNKRQPFPSLDVSIGTLYRSDDKSFHKLYRDAYAEYLPKNRKGMPSAFAGDQRDRISTTPRAAEWSTTGMVYRCRYEGRRALLRRYFRPYSTDFRAFVKLLVADIDAPGQWELWASIPGFPRPNFVVVNPVTINCQYHYLLADAVFEEDREFYWKVKDFLTSLLPLGQDYSRPPNYRSPFLSVGRRGNTEEDKKGLRQADYPLYNSARGRADLPRGAAEGLFRCRIRWDGGQQSEAERGSVPEYARRADGGARRACEPRATER
jgi:Replicase family